MKNTNGRLMACLLAVVNLAFAAPVAAPDGPLSPQAYLQFDGSNTNYVEAPDSTDFSVDTTGALTISVWMRPDALTFTNTEGSLPDEQYVHWLGKGGRGQFEWVFRTDLPAKGRAGRLVVPVGLTTLAGPGDTLLSCANAGRLAP